MSFVTVVMNSDEQDTGQPVGPLTADQVTFVREVCPLSVSTVAYAFG